LVDVRNKISHLQDSCGPGGLLQEDSEDILRGYQSRRILPMNPHSRLLAQLLGLVALVVLPGGSTPTNAQTPAPTPPATHAPSAAQEPRLSGGRPVFGPPPAVALFEAHCASCHTAEGLRIGDRVAPSVTALNALPPERIYASLATGTMAVTSAALDDRQKRDMAEYLSRRRLVDIEGTSIAAMSNRCTDNPPLPNLTAVPAWNGWGPDTTNARFQAAPLAGLTPADVPRLALKWAFGLPGGGSTSSQPTVVGGRVFVGSDTSVIFSMDARTGCAYWSYRADSPGRIAASVGPITGYAGTPYAVYFATGSATVYALDARDGKELWKTKIDGGNRVSNAAALQDGRLYVPLTGTETMSGVNPDYECCRTRGGVAALDANTGRVIWRVDSIQAPLTKLGVNPNGKTLWGPSGASVWNTPTIDPRRKRIYVGTGNSFGPVAADTSDSVLALSMDDGRIVWKHQEFKEDAFMLGCGDTNPPGGNCPERLGPDWDFGGASVILQTLSNGRQVLAAAGKGGVAIGLDPDTGELRWRTKLYDGTPPTADGLVLFGGTADGTRVYFPLQQPGGGLTALRLDDGGLVWRAALNADARGQIGAASGIPGVVFSGAWDGVLRAIDAAGKVIWSFDTRRTFETINGVQAKGGSLGSPGPTIAGGIVYVSSGYVGFQNGYPGNVVLAFAVR
jgi:polyvinyl alcohol dehydrogenase (cytochrome)